MPFEIEISNNVLYSLKYNPLEFSKRSGDLTIEEELAKTFGVNPARFKIKDTWYDVIPLHVLYRMRNCDGYYHVLYLQLNWDSFEYYIGKSNRPTWKQLLRYNGSGLRFSNEYNKHKDSFERFFIASCKTAQETEELEAKIVDETIVSDEKCLNLVCGGGGTNKHPSVAETSEKKRQYMIAHPEQYQKMLQASKRSFASGPSAALTARSLKIKETMSSDYQRRQFRERLENWKVNNPEAYKEAREKNHKSIRNAETQAKRKASFEKWAIEHPEEYEAWQKKLIESRTTDEANKKRADSIREFNKTHTEEAKRNAKNRVDAAIAKTSKAVLMIDKESSKVIREFDSQHEAARWLIENGYSKTINCVTSINGVCTGRKDSNGKVRTLAFGFIWSFKE